MKYTFGKIGIGLAGAVAAAGLMSAGVHTAQAQLELSPNPQLGGNSPNPVVNYLGDITVGSYTGPVDSWTYYLTLNPPSTAGDYYQLSTGGTFTLSNFNGYLGATVVPANWSTSYSGTTITETYSSTVTATNGQPAVNIGSFTFLSQYGVGTITGIFSSVVQSYNSLGVQGQSDYNQTTPLIPDLSVVAAPLPLPAAFWPGLMTLGGMAVVGGLRLRRRAL